MKKICFIGDSICAGLGDTQQLGWVGRISTSLPAEFQAYNLGISGQTIEQILNRAQNEINERLNSYYSKGIVLGGGLNDLCTFTNGEHRTDQDLLHKQIESLIQALSKMAPTLIIGPFPICESFNPFFTNALNTEVIFNNQYIQEIDQFYATTCEKYDIPYLPMYESLIASDDFMSSLRESDGIHPNDSGYQVAADKIQLWKAWQEMAQFSNNHN